MAILRARGCCVPLDPSYPETRLRAMLDQVGIQIILTSDTCERIASSLGRQVILVNQARLAALAKKDAAKTIQRVVLGSIVTFGAGLDVRALITGFECCTMRIKSLPADAREDEVCALLTQQGIDPSGSLRLEHLIKLRQALAETSTSTELVTVSSVNACFKLRPLTTL